jgi:uncharacterized phage protein (TIGR01671 family)
MSRVIKFRAWARSGAYSEMMENVQNHIGAATGFGHLLQNTAKGIDECHVMQFTGLYDKNSREIYEADVVQDHNGIGFVEWRNTAYRVNYQNGTAKWFYDYTLKGEFESIEVIGNTYQNPELLK